MYSGVGLTSDAFPDSDTINRTLSIIFERPYLGFALIHDAIIKEP